MQTLLDQILEHPIIKRYTRRLVTGIRLTARYIKKNYPHTRRSLIRFFSMNIVQIVSAITVIILLAIFCVFFQVGNRFDKSLYVINIPKGYGANRVAELLESRGIIDGRYGFDLIVNMFHLQNKMQAGTYEFTPNMSLIRVVFKISRGEIIPPMSVRIVFPEGLSIYKMGLFMEREGIGDGISFQELTKHPITASMMSKFPFLIYVPNRSLEGYLFPDTYMVPSNIDLARMADLMLHRFNSVVMPYWRKNYRKMKVKMSLHEIITFASIIEKEAEIESERPMIASVYANRLRVRMRLGADPTIKYVLERPGKIVSLDDLKVDSPYNTYKHYGFPPGPICNPGLSSVKAAMFPAQSDYFYFVAKADGSHVFTKNWQEHEEAKAATRTDRIRKIFRKTPQY